LLEIIRGIDKTLLLWLEMEDYRKAAETKIASYEPDRREWESSLLVAENQLTPELSVFTTEMFVEGQWHFFGVGVGAPTGRESPWRVIFSDRLQKHLFKPDTHA